MDDLIGRVVANRGADRAVAASAVDIIPQFLIPQLLRKDGSTAEPHVLALCPRGTEMPVSRPTASLPSVLGATGALMGIGTQLIKSRRSMERIRAVTRKSMTFARHTAGEDAVGEIVDAIPRLGRLV